MATDIKPKAAAEPWYPFNSGPPKPHVEPAHAAEPVHAAATAHVASPAVDFKHAVHASDIDKFAHSAPQSIVERVKPEADAMRHAYEPSKPLVEKTEVNLMSAAKPGAESAHSKTEHLASTAGAHAASVPKVHVHPPTPPRSAFGEVLHAEAKEMNRANGVISSALAQGLHPDAIKAVVENRLQGHARDVANNILSASPDAEHLSAKLGESQKVASALQAAASKAMNADHAETLVTSRLKGDAAAAGASVVQALACPSKAITVSEKDLAAAPAVRTPELPSINVAGQRDAAPAPVAAAAESAKVVTTPIPMPETSVRPDGPAALASAQEARQVSPAAQAPDAAGRTVAENIAKVVTTPIPTPETLVKPESPAERAVAQEAPHAVAAAVTPGTTTHQEKPAVVIEERSTRASAEDIAAKAAEPHSNSLGDKLHGAFSAAKGLTENLTHAVHEGIAKGEAKLHGAAESVAQVIQSASAAGSKVSLEDALTSHMQDKGFDKSSIAAAGQIAHLIRQDIGTEQSAAGSVLVLHKSGPELASIVHAKDAASVSGPGDSVLALDTLEKVAAKGMDSTSIKELRGAMPDAVQNRSDLELAQSVGPAKSDIKGFGQAPAPEQAAQKQEKAAAAESSAAAAAMSMG